MNKNQFYTFANISMKNLKNVSHSCGSGKFRNSSGISVDLLFRRRSVNSRARSSRIYQGRGEGGMKIETEKENENAAMGSKR